MVSGAAFSVLGGDADVVEDAHAVHGVDVRLGCAVIEHLHTSQESRSDKVLLGVVTAAMIARAVRPLITCLLSCGVRGHDHRPTAHCMCLLRDQ